MSAEAWVVSRGATTQAMQLVASLTAKGLDAQIKDPEAAAAEAPKVQPKAIVMNADVAFDENVLPSLRERGVGSMVVVTKTANTKTRVSQRDVVSFFVYAVDDGGDVDKTAEYVEQAVHTANEAEQAANAIDSLFRDQDRYDHYKKQTSVRMKDVPNGTHINQLV